MSKNASRPTCPADAGSERSRSFMNEGSNTLANAGSGVSRAEGPCRGKPGRKGGDRIENNANPAPTNVRSAAAVTTAFVARALRPAGSKKTGRERTLIAGPARTLIRMLYCLDRRAFACIGLSHTTRRRVDQCESVEAPCESSTVSNRYRTSA